ncbi:MAG TPA: DUF3048 domain-containing protein [Actinomycetota bacterium]|nr:DUF3048 domain-containing protein [Actinomycetota bacterium]
MALSTRGKSIAGGLAAVVLLGGGFLGYRLLTKAPNEPILGDVLGGDGLPDECPLLGVDPEGDVPNRPALAVKVENNPDSRPQAGLAEADIVYEEEAEGGITRFMAIYQCTSSSRIGPIRSARLVDPNILDQYGEPLFAYAGAAPTVRNAIDEHASIVQVNYIDAADAYTEDPNREIPHHLFSSTRALYRAARAAGRAHLPEAVFTYDEDVPTGRRAQEIRANFNPNVADVIWRYDRASGRYLRYHGTVAHTLEDGGQISSTNVVVQIVERIQTDITDPAGNPVFDFEVTGSGRAFVFRDGRMIRGRWERPNDDGVTRFVARNGDEIPLAPGNTWVELYPADAPPLEF